MATLIFSYIHRLGSFFFVQIFYISIIFGFFRKMKNFGGMKIYFGSLQNWTSFKVISMHFRSGLSVKVQNGGYFLGLLKFQIFFGCLKFLIYFWGER